MDMRAWKAVLGVGAACAACCAVPLFGGAALTAGSTALAAGSALLACGDEFVPLVLVLLALTAAGGGLFWWRRRAAHAAHEAKNRAGGCNAGCN